METQPTPARHFVSECPLPQNTVAGATYVVAAPAFDVSDLLSEAATELIAAAGLPAMEITSSVTRYGDGRKSYWLNVKDLDPERNVFHDSTGCGLADSFDGCLSQLATKLAAWATTAGLLNESRANVGEELAHV